MTVSIVPASLLLLALCASPLAAAPGRAEPQQFIVFNMSSGPRSDEFLAITKAFPARSNSPVRVGVAAIFSYLAQPRARVVQDLGLFLARAVETDTPVVVQLDGENWWGGRPDLWNWWDPAQPGYSPTNRWNVEWTGWGPEHAIRIAWRNWGRQIRVLPPPNLMSGPYRQACATEMQALIPIVLEWWRKLPADKKDLLIGVKLGWESSIGVNAWHYPNGNALLDLPSSKDPVTGLSPDQLPHRGVAQTGYAAVSTAGIRRDGQITEADIAEVIRRHLEDLSRQAATMGVPRDRLFTHVGGWKEGELLYQSALNAYSCPGWSFYSHAADPGKDTGVQQALRRTNAPFWAAVEWLFQGPRLADPWEQALRTTLRQPRCRYVCIYNWEGMRNQPEILSGIERILRGDIPR